jgi:4-alpha-glucanotransferase
MLGSNPKKEKPRSKSGKTIARDGVVPVNGKGEVSATRFASIVFLPKGRVFLLYTVSAMGTEEQNDGLAGSPAYKLRHHAVPRKGEQPDTYRKGFFLVFVLELKHRNLLVSPNLHHVVLLESCGRYYLQIIIGSSIVVTKLDAKMHHLFQRTRWLFEKNDIIICYNFCMIKKYFVILPTTSKAKNTKKKHRTTKQSTAMKIRFQLEYRTPLGEELVLNILPEDNGGKVKQYKMTTDDGVHWECEIKAAATKSAFIDYYYSVYNGDNEVRREWTTVLHRLDKTAKKAECYMAYDYWLDIPEDSYLYSSALTECVMARELQQSTPTDYQQTVFIKVRAPQLRLGERLAIVGELDAMGAWDMTKALPMTEHSCHEWVVSLDASKLLYKRFEFKFAIFTDREEAPEMWEQGENRIIEVPHMEEGQAIVYELSRTFFDIYPWKGAGVVVPIFSLRSEGSFGVGDFGDLKMMVDWAAKTSQRIIQVLPINDTNITHTWLDSYPHNPISIYALHPQYTDFRQLPEIKDKTQRLKFATLRQELNALPQIDYERMFSAKMEYLQVLFAQEWDNISKSASYKEFFKQNKEWLESYALFCCYRDKYGTATFSEWPKKLTKPTKEELYFWYFVQYNLDTQMRAAHDYARKHHVILKGEISIGVSRNSVEAWKEPRYFNMGQQTGAPPDIFSAEGQNWGYPTYNWDEMMKDGYSWWVNRFRKMAQYFDAYRLDHVLGFFRIWEIPLPQTSGLMGQFSPAIGMSREEIEGYGVPFRDNLFLVDHKNSDLWHPRVAVQYQEGYAQLNEEEKCNFNRLYNDYFYHRNNQLWYQEAMKKLPLLTQSTRMLCCAEDLGMMPECVQWVMNELRILSLEVQAIPKVSDIPFGKLSHNPYRSVCTFTTHDMPTMRQWWDEDMERTQKFYNIPLRRSGEAPHPLPGWLAKDIISRQLTAPSMLCLLSLQDWLSIDEQLRLPDQNGERINIPSNPQHYWRYRMHITIEQLMKADELNDEIKTLIVQSGRK